MIDSRRVKDLVRALTADDLTPALDLLTPEDRHDLGDALGLRADARSMKPPLVRAKLQTRPRQRADALRALAGPLLVASEEVVGAERVDDPSVDDVRLLLPRLAATFGAPLVEAVLAQLVVDDVAGAAAIAEALSDGWRESTEGEVIDVAGAIRRRHDEATAAVEAPRKPARRRPPSPAPAARPDPPASVEASTPAPAPGGAAGPEPGPGPEPEPPPAPGARPTTSSPALEPDVPPGPSLDPSQVVVDQEQDATDDVAALLADDARTAAELDAEPLFSPLDVTVIRTVVAALNQETGAPAADEVVQIVDEVVRLNTTRHSSYFHLGFLSALDPRAPSPPPEALNEQRRRWYRFGRLSGLVWQGEPEAIVSEVASHRDGCVDVLGDPRMGMSLTAPVLAALVEEEPELAVAVLEARGGVPFRDVERAAGLVYQRARRLLVERQAVVAERLFTSLHAWRDLPGGVVTGTTDDVDFAVDLLRRRSACRRSVDDFVGAEQVLAEVGERPLSDRDRSMLATERGFVAARIGHLGHVQFPDDEERAQALLERLEPGLPLFEEAVELNPRAPRASFMLGVAAWCRGDLPRAASLLERAASRLQGDPLYEGIAVASAARFHHAAALLGKLHEGDDGVAFSIMRDELAEGYRPPLRSVVETIDAFAAHNSRHCVPFARHVLHHQPELGSALADRLADLSRSGVVGAARLLWGIVHRVALGTDRRYALLEAVVRGAGLEADAELLAKAAEEIDEVLVRAADDELDSRWAVCLEDDSALREVLGPWEAELERVGVLRRLGRHDEAAQAVEGLFHRTVADDVHYEPEDLLDLFTEIVGDDPRVEVLKRRLPEPTRLPEVGDPVLETLDWHPVKVVFVGGNEKQEAYQDLIEDALRQRYGTRVRVAWEFPGWTSNWQQSAERADAELADADALVLMQFVRTNLGRHMRRVCNDHDVPWIPCTGHGRASLERAIHRAVRVAVDQVRREKGMAE